MLADCLTARPRLARQQLLRGEQHARGAVATLKGVALLERSLQIGRLAGVRDPFDGLDISPVRLNGEDKATSHDFSIKAHGACTADAVLATDMRACEAEFIADEIGQMRARGHHCSDPFMVDSQGYRDRSVH